MFDMLDTLAGRYQRDDEGERGSMMKLGNNTIST